MATSKYAVKRVYSFVHEFSNFARSCQIPIVSTDRRSLLDGELVFWLTPTLAPTIASHLLTGPEDVRLWLNSHDITAATVAALARQMEKKKPADLKSEYLAGVAETLDLLELAGPAIGIDVASQRVAASSYAESGVSKLMTELGKRTAGWSGLLHPALYLYRYIQLTPISLAEIWKEHQIASRLPLTSLADTKLQRLAFTQSVPLVPGPLDNPRGSIRGSLELAHENPLRPFIEEVATRLREFDRALEDLRINYLDPTAELIGQTSVDAKAGLEGCENSLRDIAAIVSQIRP